MFLTHWQLRDPPLDLVDALPSSTDELPPPLEIFVYAIQNILNPQPLYSQISDLLRLLTMVEFWRLRAMSIISSALVYQTYYKGMADPYLFLLPVDVELEFKSCEESSETWRECFIQIVSGCTETVRQPTLLYINLNDFYSTCNVYGSPDLTLNFGHNGMNISPIWRRYPSLPTATKNHPKSRTPFIIGFQRTISKLFFNRLKIA